MSNSVIKGVEPAIRLVFAACPIGEGNRAAIEAALGDAFDGNDPEEVIERLDGLALDVDVVRQAYRLRHEIGSSPRP